MKLNLYEEIKALTQELVAIPSINKEPGGETRIAEFIRDYYKKIPYFQAHPHQVKMVKTKNDFVDRHSTYAYVKGTKGTSSKTVILIGHIDTVGVDDYGPVREYACNTQELPRKLEEAFDLPQEVLKDLDSGDYLFGRGALDMKSGVAVHLCLLNYFSRHPEEIDGNIIAISECDEEDNSKGIITLLDELVQLKEQEGFDYVSCINADYSTNENPDDENRYIYYGSIGKLLPSFIVFGKEAHVGQAFSALDPNLLIAQITKNLSLNTEFCDTKGDEVTIPPISLKQEDTKPDYTVQTALVAHSYFNFFTHGRSPEQVMDLCKAVAVKSFDETVAYLNDQYERFCHMKSVTFTPLPWKTRVYTWKEFHGELVEIHGSAYEKAIGDFAKRLHKAHPEMDLRKFHLNVVQEAWKWTKDKSPAIIIAFGSIFNARIEMEGKTSKEKALLEAVEGAIETVRPEAKREIKTRMFYPYISDSSFMAVCDDLLALKAVEENMPSWGIKYTHEVDKIMKINVPVVNIGTFGRDGHMMTERVDMHHTFTNVPNITYETIKSLLQ